jgi:hypothetical protein
MDLTSLPTGISPANLPASRSVVPEPATPPAQAASFQEVAAQVASTETAYEASFVPITTTVPAQADLMEEDLAARTAQALVAQQSVLEALHAGADTSVLLSGLPPGSTATLLGGGWARPPLEVITTEGESLLAAFFPFRLRDVPAVTSSTKAEAARDQDKRAADKGGATTYRRTGEEEPDPGEPGASMLDILE